MSQLDLEQVAPVASRLVSVDGKTYPLESAQLIARAQGGFAVSTLEQVFANPYDEPLEVVYTLPLPADGAVLGYAVKVGERVIRGEVEPREKAAAAYKKALFEGRTAGLLEQHRVDTFEQKLGNIPGKTKVEVTIDVLHPLVFVRGLVSNAPRLEEEVFLHHEQGQWEYRFPTVVGVRYHGAAGRVPDAQGLSPDRAGPGEVPARMGFSITTDGGPQANPRSPSHRLDLDGEGGARFAEGEALDRDIVVRWITTEPEVGVRVAEGRGLPGDDGRYALVTVVPPSVPTQKFARDLIVLLDSSGSMGGLPIELAKTVVGDLLRSLEPGDHFEVLEFSNDVSPLTKGRVPFNEDHLGRVLEALQRVQANGGTEMASALEKAMKSVSEESQRQVVLVTDGGISFENDVVARAASKRNVRLHVVGVGHVPNRALTQQAAAAGRGLEVLVASHEDAAASSAKLIAGMAAPVLTQIDVVGTALTGEKPKGLRDVFAGKPLTFAVELSQKGGALTLRGKLAGQAGPWTQRIEVPASGKGSLPRSPLPIGALFGRERVAQLELEHASSGYGWDHEDGPDARTAIDHQIERVAMRHRIVSRRTSMIAISEDVTVDPRAPKRRERVAVEIPAGVSAEGLGLTGGLESHDLTLSCMMPDAPMSMLRSTIVRRMEADVLRQQVPAMGNRVGSLRVPLASPSPGGLRRFLRDASVIRFVPGMLVVEVSADDLPTDAPLHVELSGRVTGKAARIGLTFDPSLSTRLDALQPGQRVMLVFRFDPNATVASRGRAALGWRAGSFRVTCPLELPPIEEPGSEQTARPGE